MFERCTEEARRAIFYAGTEAIRLRSPYVETEHLLLGLTRENPAKVNRFAASEVSETSIRNQIMALIPAHEIIPTNNVEVRLSDESKDALSFAAEEADALGHQHIGVEHILLGLLHKQNSLAACILRDRGAGIEGVHEELASAAQPVSFESRKNSAFEMIAREAEEKARMIMEGGPDAERVRKKFAAGSWPAFPNFEEAVGATTMPGRYTEKTRRSIFFARYEAWQFGSRVVETEHLLLGLLRESGAHLDLVLPDGASVETIRRQIEGGGAIPLEKVSIRVALPLSDECKHAQAYAEEEAALLGNKHIGPEHLLLGLLREEGGSAARILREHGAELESIRKGLAA